MSNTSKKATLFTVILTVILAAAIVIGAIFGFNPGKTVSNDKTITVSVNKFAYDTQLDVVVEECEDVFGSEKVSYEIKGEMSGDASEIVFVFDKDVNVKDLAQKLNAKFDELTKEGGALEYSAIKAMANSNVTTGFVAKNYILRAAIAVVVFSVLAFIYVTIRQKWSNGIAAALAILFAATTTAAIVLFARIPVTASTMYAVCASSLFAAIAYVFGEGKEWCAKKSVLYVFGGVAVAMLAVGIGGIIAGVWANFWFSVCAILALAVAAAISLYYAPAVVEALQPVVEAQQAAKDKFAYKGAAKNAAKKEKKAAAVATAPVEEKACPACNKACEEKAEEVAEEPAAEETTEMVEETEEVVEEPVAEETTETVEETEEVVEEPVVEETTEEVVEETTEETKED